MTVEEKIKNALSEHITPILQSHGGDCQFVKFDEETGILYVALVGSCGTCPYAQETLRMTVEQTIINLVPEVREVARA